MMPGHMVAPVGSCPWALPMASAPGWSAGAAPQVSAVGQRAFGPAVAASRTVDAAPRVRGPRPRALAAPLGGALQCRSRAATLCRSLPATAPLPGRDRRSLRTRMPRGPARRTRPMFSDFSRPMPAWPCRSKAFQHSADSIAALAPAKHCESLRHASGFRLVSVSSAFVSAARCRQRL